MNFDTHNIVVVNDFWNLVKFKVALLYEHLFMII